MSPAHDVRIVHRVASACLLYPDDQLVGLLPTMTHAVHGLSELTPRNLLTPFLDYAAATPLPVLAQHYVEVFDLSRKHALYLSYWTDGDTRRRGEVLAGFKQRYRASGFVVDTHRELPDFLPMVLEYAAVADPVDGVGLLQEYRPSLELLRLALLEAQTPYAAPVQAVCATLPGPSPADRAAVMAMANAGPPRETVGLDDSDPRLLPLSGSMGRGR